MKGKQFKVLKESAGLTDVPGFLAAGVHCDVRGKQNDRLDLALVYSERPCTVAGVFTQNTFAAAPVKYGRKQLARKIPCHGFVANSGNANACTGTRGNRDVEKMQADVAAALGKEPEHFYIASTGRIGECLPMERIEKGINLAAGQLCQGPEAGSAAADAILTSDTRRKVVSISIQTSQGKIAMSGMAKGAGMIEPNMATMLGFITTDAVVSKGVLQKSLSKAIQGSFNAITIDGDQSTNDTVLLLANGASGVRIKADGKQDYSAFMEGLDYVCRTLARMIVGDGEKITKVVDLHITGAKTDREAEKAARAIGNSLLVKSSWYGNDPNWGRLVDALGYSGAQINHDKFSLSYQASGKSKPIPAFRESTVVAGKKPQWKKIVSEKNFQIHIELGVGNGTYQLLASDLTEGYVNFNKSE